MKPFLSRSRLLKAVIVVAFAILARSAAAQDGGDGAEGEETAQVVDVNMLGEAFESWVFGWGPFGTGQTAQALRTHLEKVLELYIDEVDRTERLGDEARKKLFIAGQADIKRHFENVDALRRKFLASQKNARKGEDRLGDIWKEIEPLRLKVAEGLFRDGSLFRKTLRRTIAPEHAARHEQNQKDRRAFDYRARVEWVVAMMDNVMPMREEQRQELVKLLLLETRPPKKSGHYDHYVILWQVSLMPDDKLKPLLSESQWKVLLHQFSQIKGQQDHLRRQGWLELEGDPPRAVEGEPAPAASEK